MQKKNNPTFRWLERETLHIIYNEQESHKVLTHSLIYAPLYTTYIYPKWGSNQRPMAWECCTTQTWLPLSQTTLQQPNKYAL